jgi:hypothetical protein
MQTQTPTQTQTIADDRRRLQTNADARRRMPTRIADENRRRVGDE